MCEWEIQYTIDTIECQYFLTSYHEYFMEQVVFNGLFAQRMEFPYAERSMNTEF